MNSNSPYAKSLLSLQNVTFRKSSQQVIHNLSFSICEGEQWVLLGETGSGKSTLLECLAGKYYLQEGSLTYHFDKNAIALVGFQEQSKLLDYSNFYYQQRYYASETEGIITAQEFIYQSLFQKVDKDEFERITVLLNLKEVLHLEIIKLSNGQKRKLLLAKALLKKPKLLLLDNPYIGLDTPSRQLMSQMINRLIESNLQIVLVANKEDIPEKITHIAVIENFKIRQLNSVEDLPKKQIGQVKGAYFPIKNDEGTDFKVAVQFKNVNVSYDKKQVLKNINWTVRKGEKWALLGDNGSGKSTLLSLIYADHPQSYANDILLFDHPRGKGETIWDIKKMIGFISPELHFYLKNQMTAFEVVATGFFDGFSIQRQLTPEEEGTINAFFQYYYFRHLLQRKFQHLSTGEQRVVLLMRALVKKPDLLIMDEPFQNLDEQYIKLSLSLLDMYLTDKDTLIYVTHYPEEIPKIVNHFLHLKNGEQV